MAAWAANAEPPPMTAEEQHLAALLRETTAADANRIGAAEAQLASASDQPGFAAALLGCVSRAAPGADGQADPNALLVAVPAAAALHNYARARWPHKLIPGEREPIRAAILQSLLVAPPSGPVVRLLAETFRIVVTEDVTRAKRWPDLLPALCGAMQESNLMVGKEQSRVRTANALVAVHTLLKPYKYFQNPGEAKEAAPPELEAIVKALLEPLLGMLGVLAGGALRDAAADAAGTDASKTHETHGASSSPEKSLRKRQENDALLLVLLKCFHHTIAAYMPNALVPSLRHWLEVLVKILERAPTFFQKPGFADLLGGADHDASGAWATPRRKAVKRAIQCLISLVTRHRRHVDKAMPALCSHATALAGALASARADAGAEDEPCPVASRTSAACFDLLARVAETAPGFKLLAPNFGRLLEQAIFPTLRAAADDERDWEEDEEEYLRRNLPADAADDVTGFNEELYAPRQSAANVLALLAERGSGGGAGALGGSPGDDGKPGAQDKRGRSNAKKASRGSRKNGLKNDTPGDVALAFLERFPPPDGSGGGSRLDGNGASNYYGALVAYGALANWLAKHKAREPASRGALATLIRRRVLPATAPAGAESETASAMLRANACWALGELAATDAVPPSEAHAALLGCLTDPAGAEHPALRSAAAAAIAAALHASVWPEDWTPLLTAAAAAAAPERGGEDDADASRLRAIRLIAVAAEAAPEHCGAPATATALAAALARAASGRTPAPPATLPPLVEAALEALVAVVEAAAETAEEEEEESREASPALSFPKPPHPQLVALVPHCCDALRRAWLPSAWGLEAWPASSGDSGDTGMMTGGDDGDLGSSPAGGAPAPCCLGDCSRLLTKALEWCPDAASARAIDLGGLVVAHAELLEEWDALGEEEDASATAAVAAAAEAFARGSLPPAAANAALPLYARFVADAIDSAPIAVACARACRASHAVLGLASKLAPTHAPTHNEAVAALGEAATARLSSLESPDLPLARPLALAVAACVARTAASARLDVSPDVVADWARAASRALARDDGDFAASELRLVAVAALRALAGGAAVDSEARAGVVECALRAVIGLRDIDGDVDDGVAENDDDDDDSDEDDDDDSDEDDDDDDDSDEEDANEYGGGDGSDEETEAAFLARYAAEARRMAGEGPEHPDAGDVDDAEDGEEVSLDGVQIGPPGAEATALLGWLSSAASAGDLGALAATLQARPIAGLERVGDLRTVLSSMAVSAGANQTNFGAAGFPTPGAASPSNSQGGIDFGGLRL